MATGEMIAMNETPNPSLNPDAFAGGAACRPLGAG